MGRRQKVARTARARRSSLAMGPNDLAALEFVAAVKCAIVMQVALAIGISDDRARRLCRRLYDLGYLSAHLVDSRQPTLWTLSAQGRRFLKEQRPDLRLSPATPLRLHAIERETLLNFVRLFCAQHRPDVSPLIRWAAGRSSLSAELAVGVDPDAFARFAVPGGTAVVAIEADVASTSAASVLRCLDRYRAVAASGRLDGLWIATNDDAARVRVLGERLLELGLGSWSRVFDLPRLVRRPCALPPHPGEG